MLRIEEVYGKETGKNGVSAKKALTEEKEPELAPGETIFAPKDPRPPQAPRPQPATPMGPPRSLAARRPMGLPRSPPTPSAMGPPRPADTGQPTKSPSRVMGPARPSAHKAAPPAASKPAPQTSSPSRPKRKASGRKRMATSKKSSKRSPSSKRKRQPTKAPARSRKTPAPPKPAPAKPPTRSYLEDAPVEIPKPTKVILIVDDHKDMQESIQTLLELSVPNVRILTASTAEEGLEVLGRESVQLIVSDYRMPGMDGVSFLKKARAMVPNVARVLLTAHPRMAVAMPEVEQAGIHQVLVKPMPSDALVRSVQEIFRRKGHDDLVPVAMKQLVEQAENPAH